MFGCGMRGVGSSRIFTMPFIFLIFSRMPVTTEVPQQVFSPECPLPHPLTTQKHTRKNVPGGATSCCGDRYGERPRYFYLQNLAMDTLSHTLTHLRPTWPGSSYFMVSLKGAFPSVISNPTRFIQQVTSSYSTTGQELPNRSYHIISVISFPHLQETSS